MDRPLDGLERRFWLLGQAVSVNVVATSRVRGAFDARDVRAALDAVQTRHAPLRVHVDDGPPPRFVSGAPALRLRRIGRREDDAWHAVAEAELGERFPSSPGPLLRATLVQRGDVSELILACHHAIGDAFALFGLTGEVLRRLAGEPAGPPSGDEPLGALVPPGDRGLAGRIAFLREAQRLASEAKRVRADGLRRERDVPPTARRSRIVQRILDPAATGRLTARARREATTVQGALAAAALRAVREDAGRDIGLGCQHAVNLGARLPRRAPDAFGLHAVGVPTYHRVAAQPFWHLARETHAGLGALLARRVPLLTPAYLEATMPRDAAAAAEAIDRADRLDLAAIVVTNLGRLDASPGPPPSWETFHFAAAVNLGCVVMVAATTFRGTLTCNFVTPEPLIGLARAQRLADTAMAELGSSP